MWKDAALLAEVNKDAERWVPLDWVLQNRFNEEASVVTAPLVLNALMRVRPRPRPRICCSPTVTIMDLHVALL